MRTGTLSAYCAEAGLSAARPLVTATIRCGLARSAPRRAELAGDSDHHDLDGDGAADFVITLKDNDDVGGGRRAMTSPTTMTCGIFIVSRCTKYSEVPKEIGSSCSIRVAVLVISHSKVGVLATGTD